LLTVETGYLFWGKVMEIKGEGLHCRLQFSAPDQEGWIGTIVKVDVPGFGGTYSCAIEIREFEQLVHLLRQLENAVGSGE
jgi:hypothetical protein